MTRVLVFESISKRALVGSVYDAAIFNFLPFLRFLWFSFPTSNACQGAMMADENHMPYIHRLRSALPVNGWIRYILLNYLMVMDCEDRAWNLCVSCMIRVFVGMGWLCMKHTIASLVEA